MELCNNSVIPCSGGNIDDVCMVSFARIEAACSGLSGYKTVCKYLSCFVLFVWTFASCDVFCKKVNYLNYQPTLPQLNASLGLSFQLDSFHA